MNKVKKVLMTMFGFFMFPLLLFACSNTQSQGVEAIKAKGKNWWWPPKSRVCSI